MRTTRMAYTAAQVRGWQQGGCGCLLSGHAMWSLSVGALTNAHVLAVEPSLHNTDMLCVMGHMQLVCTLSL